MRQCVRVNIITVLSFLPFCASIAQAQQVNKGMIDGSVTPELIPDNIAFMAVLRAIAEPPSASLAKRKRMEAKLRAIGLKEEDIVAARPILTGFHDAMAQLDTDIGRLQASSGDTSVDELTEQYSLLTARRSKIRDSVRHALQQELSSQGMTLLRLFIKRAKTHMKYIPE